MKPNNCDVIRGELTRKVSSLLQHTGLLCFKLSSLTVTVVVVSISLLSASFSIHNYRSGEDRTVDSWKVTAQDCTETVSIVFHCFMSEAIVFKSIR